MNTQELKQYIDRVLGNNIRCLLPSYWWKKLFGEVVDNIDSVSKSVDSVSKSTKNLITRVDKLEDNSKGIIKVTYEELCDLENSHSLIPGQYYQITDYECAINTDDPNISVISKNDSNYVDFDILVLAISESNISRNAVTTTNTIEPRCYEIKYTLENDPNEFSWARRKDIDYDVVYYDKQNNDTWFFVWDDTQNVYQSSYIYNKAVLVTSLTDTTPISKTTFNKGDTIYILYNGVVKECTATYVSSMKDTGEGAIINNKPKSTYSKTWLHPYVWDDNIFNSFSGYRSDHKDGFYFIETDKKEYFTSREYLSVVDVHINYEKLFTISNWDVAIFTGSLYMYFNWNSDLNKYILFKDDSSYYYLGTSSTDSTPLQKDALDSLNEVHIYLYENESYLYGGQFTFLLPNENTVAVTNTQDYYYGKLVTWDDTKQCYTTSDNQIVTLKEGYSIVPKDFDFYSDIEYGNVSFSNYSNSIGQVEGFDIPEGKGVIYYMKDHQNNEAPYDFKHILFKFPEVEENPRFTFNYKSYSSAKNNKDYSEDEECVNNKINTFINIDGIQKLNKVSLYNPIEVEVSSKVSDTCFKEKTNYKYIGLDKKNNLSTVSIYDINAEPDSEISDTSENIVQNKAIKNYVDNIKKEILREVVNNEEVIATAFSESIKNFDNVHESIYESINEVKERTIETLVININRNDGTFTIDDSDVSNVYNAIVLINGLSDNSSILYSRSSPRNIFLDLMTGVFSFSCHDAYTIENGILTSIQYKCSVTLNHDTGTVESIVGTKISTKLNSDNITYNIESINLLNDEVISSREFNIPITNVESI